MFSCYDYCGPKYHGKWYYHNEEILILVLKYSEPYIEALMDSVNEQPSNTL